MNYLPFCGYWFYGAANATEMISFYSSWGLLAIAPESALLTLGRIPNMPYHAFIPTMGEI